MNMNDIMNSFKQLNSPLARNVMDKVNSGDVAGVNQIAENLMQSNAGDPRVQQMMQFYRNKDLNGLIAFLSGR